MQAVTLSWHAVSHALFSQLGATPIWPANVYDVPF